MSEIPKKKILFVITKSNFGGAQRYVYDLATSLPKEKFDVVVAFGQGGELEEKLNTAGIRTIFIKSLQRDVSVWKDFAVFFELLKIYKKEKPDVVHLNSSKIGGIGALAARFSDDVPKIIFTAHGWAFNEKRSFLSRKIIAFLHWFTVLLSHTTIAVSQSIANQILKFPFINPKKITVIYNGVAEIAFEDRVQARAALANKDLTKRDAMLRHAFWIGTISELHNNKGLDIALNAFAEISKIFNQAIFVIIGEGEERARLTKRIAEFDVLYPGFADRVFLLGFIPEAKKYLKAFDVFTLTSRTEALPYVIVEAGLAALPIVASKVGGIPEIINSKDMGILVATGENAESEIKTALEKLIPDTKLQKTLGENLQKRIRAEFSYEKMHTETFALY